MDEKPMLFNPEKTSPPHDWRLPTVITIGYCLFAAYLLYFQHSDEQTLDIIGAMGLVLLLAAIGSVVVDRIDTVVFSPDHPQANRGEGSVWGMSWCCILLIEVVVAIGWLLTQ